MIPAFDANVNHFLRFFQVFPAFFIAFCDHSACGQGTSSVSAYAETPSPKGKVFSGAFARIPNAQGPHPCISAIKTGGAEPLPYGYFHFSRRICTVLKNVRQKKTPSASCAKVWRLPARFGCGYRHRLPQLPLTCVSEDPLPEGNSFGLVRKSLAPAGSLRMWGQAPPAAAPLNMRFRGPFARRKLLRPRAQKFSACLLASDAGVGTAHPAQ